MLALMVLSKSRYAIDLDLSAIYFPNVTKTLALSWAPILSDGTDIRVQLPGPNQTAARRQSVTVQNEIQSVDSVPLLDVCRGNQPLKQEILETVSEIFDSGRFIGGPHCQSLERAVNDICDTEFSVGCASGSDALLLALMACDIGTGDEVICPSFTFFATASAIERLGATPVFVDIEPDSFNMDVECLSAAVTKRTKAIIPVHLFGQCCDMDPIVGLARDFNLKVIEDAAQAIGATYQGRPAGSIGDIGCFSFYPTKNLGGCGDGGMLTTKDADLADRLRLLANHGMRPRYYHQEIGVNSRLDAIQAAVLRIKIRYILKWSDDRARNAKLYEKRNSCGLAWQERSYCQKSCIPTRNTFGTNTRFAYRAAGETTFANN